MQHYYRAVVLQLYSPQLLKITKYLNTGSQHYGLHKILSPSRTSLLMQLCTFNVLALFFPLATPSSLVLIPQSVNLSNSGASLGLSFIFKILPLEMQTFFHFSCYWCTEKPNFSNARAKHYLVSGFYQKCLLLPYCNHKLNSVKVEVHILSELTLKEHFGTRGSLLVHQSAICVTLALPSLPTAAQSWSPTLLFPLTSLFAPSFFSILLESSSPIYLLLSPLLCFCL